MAGPRRVFRYLFHSYASAAVLCILTAAAAQADVPGGTGVPVSGLAALPEVLLSLSPVILAFAFAVCATAFGSHRESRARRVFQVGLAAAAAGFLSVAVVAFAPLRPFTSFSSAILLGYSAACAALLGLWFGVVAWAEPRPPAA